MFVVMWCYWLWLWHQKWPHCTLCTEMIKIQMRCNMTFFHLMQLVMVPLSHYANNIVNGTIAFVMLRNGNELQHDVWSYDVTGIVMGVLVTPLY